VPTKTDNGRVYIPKHLREKYGERYKIVDSGDGLLLVPVPEDPLDALRDEWSDVDTSVEEMRDEARAEAIESAGERNSE
jgi:bifunctional DNA-binding transcriptional regulator/antitoxin component of YhaV-PrlF toxin-antitoxin module